MKALIVFDLDGTLALSKSAIDAETAALLVALLGVARVAVISGADLRNSKRRSSPGSPTIPTCESSRCSQRAGRASTRTRTVWTKLYAEDLGATQKHTIVAALEKAVAASGFAAEHTWGETIEDRESQITYSALGQQAPLDAKSSWDPDFKKRQAIKTLLDPELPDFSVRLGGATSIDITLPGIDKAYGIRKLRDILGIAIRDMLYIGDALFPGGNDYPAREAGCTCIQVRDPEETKRVIETIVACYSGDA